MDIHAHARPHLEVHTRSKGHSAVAGAAYRLGLRLYDERQKCWHNFQKRALGEEIVRALTIAPKGAPAWASDPAQLWNRVEASEKRKDAQVARDYRIPVPFGLTDDQAGQMAEEMARFICDELEVPVSMGLHRDADRDALGNLKPAQMQGFHAHLYFPTRPLAETDTEDGKSGAGKEGKDFGPKLHDFSKMHLGSAFIELLNCRWSELANDYARKAGSSSKYEYKSYKRLGVSLVPQPTLGRSATAMERRGITSNRGDSLREALVMAEVYQKAHTSALDAQHVQARSDIVREGGKTSGPRTGVLARHASSYFGARKNRASIEPFVPRQGSLAYRLKMSAPVAASKEEHDELERSLVLIEALDKAFAAYHRLQNELDEILRAIEAKRASSLDATYQVDRSRELRKVAQVRLRRWEDEHRFRIKMFASMGGSPMVMHEKLRKGVRLHDDHVQALKATIANHGSDVAELGKKLSTLEVQRAEALSIIRDTASKLDGTRSNLMPEIIKALPDADRALVKGELSLLFEGLEPNEEVHSVGLTPSPSFKSPASG